MPRWIRAIGMVGLLLAGPGEAAERLRLVGDSWAPFTDAGLLNGGLATDIVSTALARAGYASSYEQVPWARALRGVAEGRYDVLVNAWYTEERTRIGQFSAEYLVNRILFVKRRDALFSEWTPSMLHRHTIGVVRGYAYSPSFDEDTSLHKVPVVDFSMAVRMLAAGRIDLTLEDEFVARHQLAVEDASVRDALEFMPMPLAENSLHILVSLKHPDHARIVQRFDAAIAAMKADGSYQALLRRHGF
ncbi:transporter substrate-binding domain-containing protein [Pseudomonas sp. DTU_2021_1001937_2_SI_NGA_ILE_001]|uniref:substrate-binding periplasmic protein n=1 Tax=Pseudomonas sp. DTU_2021_1001937_2_SI_NGA_ILE_001 TaxID=3077589 RepID=UPI0028FC216C|nr:transporter substrate-binding domain-containing protein [Pseudomonas sp. DTU_2021_1001937_2_SI_NGA_ILE_001]WNW13050.1 transporter substrate-binding domain-containing protein [Pseudomonas sp. DTU_2021_1001937_2_SI_NGA_ILE_001]